MHLNESAQSWSNPTNEIPEDSRVRRQNQEQRQHYSFSKEGFALFSESMISVSIPIQILPLFPLLNQTQHLAVTLRNQARLHKETSSGGFLKTLNNLAFEKYRVIKSKFDTVRFFYSDPRNETLQAEADLISRDPEFDFTEQDISNSEFIANHNNFVESREQLGDLLQEIMQKMTTTTTTTTERPGHQHAGRNRNRSKRSDSKPSPPHIDPSNYIPKVEKYDNYLAKGKSKRQIFGFLGVPIPSINVSWVRNVKCFWIDKWPED